MIRERFFGLLAVFLGLVLVSCDFGEEQQDGQKIYEVRMKKAQSLKDTAEKLYLEAMGHDAGTEERNSLLRKAYDQGEKAMNIFNQLDEQFGHRVIPEGEVLAHRPIMKSLSELMVRIVRAMPAVD
jgi:hypothetical protein